LIIIDSLTTLASLSSNPASNLNLIAFLSSLLQPSSTQPKDPEQEPSPQISLVAVYHTDVPLPTNLASSSTYSPSPVSLLSYFATTLITVHSLAILIAERAAQAKSLAAPAFGLTAEVEGEMVGLKPNTLRQQNPVEGGTVLELEHRRKSGRGIREWFYLPALVGSAKPSAGAQPLREPVILLDDHPLFRKPRDASVDAEQELSGMTFELGLTERQRLEREGVVLPYFDAQKAGGGGEGGRILYDMGVEDDFDEEEDEI
jgi:elongator complex protein 5